VEEKGKGPFLIDYAKKMSLPRNPSLKGYFMPEILLPEIRLDRIFISATIRLLNFPSLKESFKIALNRESLGFL
jgi:hypothetical protein